ncbi:MAG: VWA domain-containing protein [Sedimentisphaerales bacterium]|nr:VWA domain-containing protein [Sedimentisphaerales bacterium]
MRTKIFIAAIVLCLVTSSLVIYMIAGCSAERASRYSSLRLANKSDKSNEEYDLLREDTYQRRNESAVTEESSLQSQEKAKNLMLPPESNSRELLNASGSSVYESESYTPPGSSSKYEPEISKIPISNDGAKKPYSDALTLPENWKDLSGRKTRQSISGGMEGGRGGADKFDVSVFGPVPLLGDTPLVGNLFGRDDDGKRLSQVQLRNELMNFSADEIWVIAKVDAPRRVVSDDYPGSGAMLAKLPKQEKEIPLPLKHTDVKGDICGYIATVEVTQQFQNPYKEKIEAVYVFPLPDNAAVNEFIMIIGDRKIRGIIREREEAEQIYQQARDQGYTASLLTQERPNIFTQKVANIEPSKKIDVNIKYFSTLAYVDGWYEFVFPMVVGPRYNPPGYTAGVGAVAHGRTGISGQDTEVQYLKPNERSGHDISLAVNIDAGVAIEEIKCPSHVIKKSPLKEEKLTVKLSELDNIPNKDFVLRYKVAGSKVKSAFVTHQDKRGGYFTLMLYPPESLKNVQRAPMEMIFVLDCSGSMNGKPIEKAKDAINRALRQLQPNDTFQIIRFSNNASQLGPQPIPATAENIRKGLEYAASLNGSGGTQMIEGVKAALDFAHDPERFRLVSFMTDGYIGNEADILEAVHDKLGASRIFSFGVGSSVNRFLLDRMAVLGKGAVAYIGLDEEAGEVIDLFYERISHPALTDVTIDWGGLEVTEVYPNKIPDLFVGRPIIVTGRFTGSRDTKIRINGKVGNVDEQIAIAVDLDDEASNHPGIACVWARRQIETLANQATYDQNAELPVQIKQVALEYGLMSSYTAFIAVDSSRQTLGDHGFTAVVPVPVPYGVRYDTTVQE